MTHIEIETAAQLRRHIRDNGTLEGTVIQGLDLTSEARELARVGMKGAVFLGCTLPEWLGARAGHEGALVFPRLGDIPFDPFRATLYTPDELVRGYAPGADDTYGSTRDGRIYEHFLATGGPRPADIVESLARRLHDHSISDALEEFIAGRRVVAIMGGHALRRDAPAFEAVARLARTLSRRGYLMASGGGPGAMEATHLGAWLAPHPDDALARALSILAQAPTFPPAEAWLDRALEVVATFPNPGGEDGLSLGIPTWLYGHEPPTVFARRIAKYFANSVREEGLLAIARSGVVFAPGGAGTLQEVFQNAAQNRYETYGPASPMIFFGARFWTETVAAFQLLSGVSAGTPVAAKLTATDDIAEVVAAIERSAG